MEVHLLDLEFYGSMVLLFATRVSHYLPRRTFRHWSAFAWTAVFLQRNYTWALTEHEGSAWQMPPTIGCETGVIGERLKIRIPQWATNWIILLSTWDKITWQFHPGITKNYPNSAIELCDKIKAVGCGDALGWCVWYNQWGGGGVVGGGMVSHHWEESLRDAMIMMRQQQ